MKVIPAIDLLNGKCVCLTRGERVGKKIYSEEPIEVAKSWEQHGAELLHVINLDSAFTGSLKNTRILRDILKAVNIPVQVGGGIRDERIASELFGLGAAKIILGTILVSNEKVAERIIAKYQDGVLGAIDSLSNGMVAIKGWQLQTELSCFELASKLEKLGVGGIIFTDISRDGTMTSPDFELVTKFVSSVNLPVYAAGGIATLRDIKGLKKAGVEGIIVGKALYEKKFSLEEALEAAARDEFN